MEGGGSQLIGNIIFKIRKKSWLQKSFLETKKLSRIRTLSKEIIDNGGINGDNDGDDDDDDDDDVDHDTNLVIGDIDGGQEGRCSRPLPLLPPLPSHYVTLKQKNSQFSSHTHIRGERE